MSKATLSAALVLVACFGLPAVAQAATPQTHLSFAVHAENEGGDDNGADDNGGDDNGSSYSVQDPTGANQDKDDSFVVPPVVIHPDGKGAHPLNQLPGHPKPLDVQPRNFNDMPGKHPVQLDKVHPSNKTPTDVFVDAAVVGLGAVGAGAIGLGVTVGVRAIRARKSGTKADYLYGE